MLRRRDVIGDAGGGFILTSGRAMAEADPFVEAPQRRGAHQLARPASRMKAGTSSPR
ncbi:hypothetical protein [Streptomyces anthocyanicus]|uniref:hypothetical protein n=1 Tax=Streptomyces anthocyanicus TaxID=68174 RepID=UPI00167120AA|nr:hypothetical protein [Streptomyces anthocyanicus]